MEGYNDLSTPEKVLFRRTLRYLIYKTFIVKEKDDENRKMYMFVIRNTSLISDYMKPLGYNIIADKDGGVVMLTNERSDIDGMPVQANRHRLKKNESIVLCCLWSIYHTKITKHLVQAVYVTPFDIQNELDRYGVRKEFEKKSYMEDILKKFSDFNLLDVEGTLNDPECRIRLYPSLRFSLDETGFAEYIKNAEQRMMTGKKSEQIEDEEPEDDIGSADYEG